jgi:hypothetical protein
MNNRRNPSLSIGSSVAPFVESLRSIAMKPSYDPKSQAKLALAAADAIEQAMVSMQSLENIMRHLSEPIVGKDALRRVPQQVHCSRIIGECGFGATGSSDAGSLTGTLPDAVFPTDPPIADFTQAQHTHASAAEGGSLIGPLAMAPPIGIGNLGTVPSQVGVAVVSLIVGNTASTTFGNLTLGAAVTGLANTVGVLDFANYQLAATDKRIAFVAGVTDGAQDSGALVFYTWNLGGGAERVRISTTGQLLVGTSTAGLKCTIRVGAPGIDGLRLTSSDSRQLDLMPSLSAGAYNPAVQAGDIGMIFSLSGPDTGFFVLAPWSTTGASGMRMDRWGNVVFTSTNPGSELKLAGNDPFLVIDDTGGSGTYHGVKFSPSLGMVVRSTIGALELWATNLVMALRCMDAGHVVQRVPNTAVTDSIVLNNMLCVWYNEGTNQLTFRVRNSVGTLKTGVLAVA